jgi:hypothetical protein
MRETPNDGSGLEMLGRITVALAVVGVAALVGVCVWGAWKWLT